MISQRLKELRKEKGITQKQFSEIFQVASGTIAMWEIGKRQPDIQMIDRIASYFDVSVDYLLGKTDIKNPLPRNMYPIEEVDFIVMPVLASVKAGYDGQAIVEYSDETIPVAKIAYKGYPKEECTVMRVSGDSMYPKLLDGDYILVHQQSSVDSGNIAIVIYNGDEATVKKVRYIPGEDWVELIPANPEYQTRKIEGSDLEQCRVFGLVLGLVYRDM